MARDKWLDRLKFVRNFGVFLSIYFSCWAFTILFGTDGVMSWSPMPFITASQPTTFGTCYDLWLLGLEIPLNYKKQSPSERLLTEGA